MKVSAKLICKLYQQERNSKLNTNLLFEVASRLNEIAQTVPGYDGPQDDHDWAKDAEKFNGAYTQACQGKYPTYLSYQSTNQYLMHEIDTLLAGCHAQQSMADYYIEGGIKLLDAIFNWNGKGNLFEYYQNNFRKERAR